MLAQTGWRGGGVVLDGGKLGKVGVEMKDGEGQLFLASVGSVLEGYDGVCRAMGDGFGRRVVV